MNRPVASQAYMLLALVGSMGKLEGMYNRSNK